MKYDIFISYSRKDSLQVNSLIDRLRREIPRIKIWYDIEGIESADAFRRKIISAIEDSSVVLFACSDHSLESEFCEKEIMYAKNVDKKVIPYLLPGMRLKGWILFEYGNINCINATKPDEVARLIKDIKRWKHYQLDTQISTRSDADNSGTDRIKETSNTRETPLETKTSGNPSIKKSSNTKESPLVSNRASGEIRQKADKITDKTHNKITEVSRESESKNVAGTGFINGHEYVDLGLPSGLKWATCNVGAFLPEEYGDYFAWGDISKKSCYREGKRKPKGNYREWLKNNGFIGEEGNLTIAHDAARHNWGATWRMPTLNEVAELIDNTIAEWTTQKGIKGCVLKSKINNNSIFLPAAGNRDHYTLHREGEFGFYWSSTPYDDTSGNCSLFDTYYLSVSSDDPQYNWTYRYFGYSIRPVSE